MIAIQWLKYSKNENLIEFIYYSYTFDVVIRKLNIQSNFQIVIFQNIQKLRMYSIYSLYSEQRHFIQNTLNILKMFNIN